MNRNCQDNLEARQLRKDEEPYLSVEAFIVSVITPGVTEGGRVSFNVFATYSTSIRRSTQINLLRAYRGTKLVVSGHL